MVRYIPVRAKILQNSLIHFSVYFVPASYSLVHYCYYLPRQSTVKLRANLRARANALRQGSVAGKKLGSRRRPRADRTMMQSKKRKVWMCSYDIAPMVKKYQKSKNEQNNKQNKIIEKNVFSRISISFCLIRKKQKKTVDMHSCPRCDRRAMLTVTHVFVNTVYNRKRHRCVILHKIVMSRAIFSWLPILCGPA